MGLRQAIVMVMLGAVQARSLGMFLLLVLPPMLPQPALLGLIGLRSSVRKWIQNLHHHHQHHRHD
jgi:hypothetical protein